MPGKSVLIVEDEGIVLLNLKSILEYRGYSVADAVASGEDAVRSVERKRPDIVLMDIVLDGPIDGIEATKRILALCDVPVVYMTAYSGQDVLQRAKTTNPYGFLVKPIGENELVSSIEIALYKHEMKRRLRESTGKYRLIVENLNDVVFSTDENGVITFISRGVDEASGYEPAEIVGNAFGNFVHPADREKAAQVLLRLSSGEAVRSEYRLVHKNGSDLWIRTSSKPFFVNGRFAGVRGVLTDITRSKAVEAELEKKNEELEALNEELIATNEELEASNEAFETQNRELIEAQISVTSSQQRLEYALDAASDGLWDWDVKSGKVYYSARFYTMAGYDPDDFPALFESWRERVHPEDLPEALQRLVEHAAGKSAQYSMEFRFRKKDGCWIWILSRGKVVERDRAGAALRVVERIWTLRR
jgi:PAS domain S-box-containing protein